MSADTTEQDEAGGHDMRARYLPVSRRELRRLREEELAQQRAAQEEADATSDELAQAAQGETAPESEDELSRVVEDTEAVEAVDLPAPPQREDSSAESLVNTDSEAEDTDAEDTDAEDAEAADSAEEAAPEVPEAELPEPADEQWPARPEEEAADAADAQDTAAALNDTGAHDAGAIESDVALSPEEVAALTAEQDADASEDQPEDTDADTETDSAAEDELETEDPLPEAPEFIDEQDAPIPASRRAQRLLRDTESLPKLAPELMDELNETTGQIAKHDDPDRVDPELLKKQQALAAKAMQANQARMRQQQAESDREAQSSGHKRPDSEVITGKTVRDARDGDHQEDVFLTGHIEPVDAQGAHGLELNEMLDESSKQAGRQNMMMWLLIVLAVLLLVAVGVVIFTVFL